MNCKNCGSPLTGAETLCPMCGFQVNAYNNQAPVAGAVPVQPMAGGQPVAPVQGVPTVVGASPVVVGAPEMPVGGIPEMPVDQPNVNVPVQPVPVSAPAQPAPMPAPTPIDPAVVSNVSQSMGTTQVNPMPVDNSQAMPTPVPVDPMAVNGVVQQGVPDVSANPNMMAQPDPMAGGVQMQPQMQAQPQPQSLTNENQKQPKAGNKRQTILLIILVLCIIGAVVYYVFIFPEGSSSSSGGGGSSKNNGSDTSEVEVEKKEASASYGGYTFTIPDGFVAIEGDSGLTISSYDTAYIIAVDYTNNLDAYKAAYLASNPQLATTLENTYFDRNYLLVGYNAEDGSNGVNFVSSTSADNKEVFVGTVLKNGGVAPIPDDYSDLTTILNSAVVDSENSVKAGDALDAGKAGFYVSNVSANTITFNSN